MKYDKYYIFINMMMEVVEQIETERIIYEKQNNYRNSIFSLPHNLHI